MKTFIDMSKVNVTCSFKKVKSNFLLQRNKYCIWLLLVHTTTTEPISLKPWMSEFYFYPEKFFDSGNKKS